jgi:hypothetical protein
MENRRPHCARGQILQFGNKEVTCSSTRTHERRQGAQSSRKRPESSHLASARQFEVLRRFAFVFGLFTGHFKAAPRRFSIFAALLDWHSDDFRKQRLDD